MVEVRFQHLMAWVHCFLTGCPSPAKLTQGSDCVDAGIRDSELGNMGRGTQVMYDTWRFLGEFGSLV